MNLLKLLASAGLIAMSFATVDASAGIAGTKHDWSASAGQTVYLWLNLDGTETTYNTGTPSNDAGGKQKTTKIAIGLCTKCHTPHQAKSQTLLWNHTLGQTQYKWDDPNTTAGTPYATFKADTYKGPTTKCLSCHDGLLASTDGMWFNRQSVTGNKYVCTVSSTNACLNSGHEVAEGAEMSKSHPVAMPYPLNGASNTSNFVANGANIEPSEWVADPMATNKIRLFQDDGAGNVIAGASSGKTGIECTSCHDVHNGARVKDVLLLTGKIAGNDKNPGGYICTQCHNIM